MSLLSAVMVVFVCMYVFTRFYGRPLYFHPMLFKVQECSGAFQSVRDSISRCQSCLWLSCARSHVCVDILDGFWLTFYFERQISESARPPTSMTSIELIGAEVALTRRGDDSSARVGAVVKYRVGLLWSDRLITTGVVKVTLTVTLQKKTEAVKITLTLQSLLL